MLTKKQKGLFDILGLKDEEEGFARNWYATVKCGGLVKKPFTGWLEDCVKAKWRREHERLKGPYLGD